LKAGDMVNQGMGHMYTKLLNRGIYPAPFSLDTLFGPKYPDSGFDLPVRKDVADIIKKYSRAKYGRDITVINEDIKIRSQLDRKSEPNPMNSPFPSMRF
jgi:hypothetical protein